MARGILLDIEGTTTPITFVYDVLFPFARRHIQEYVKNGGNVSDLNVPPEEEPATYLLTLMDQDKKSTALKRIQGEIWLKGYENGELHGEVFPDVPPSLEHWHRSGIDIRIFSSGSILAQRLLFSSTQQGDLTRFLNGYFDTTTGPKNEPASYKLIANTFGLPPSEILFISDVTRELDAAEQAGMQTRLCVRPGNHPQPENHHRVVREFSEI